MSSQGPTRQVRRLGLPAAGAVVVANMIGTGIFTTTGLLLAQVGRPAWVLAAWVLGGLLALAGALVYAELGAMFPRAGGEYAYLAEAFHPAVGFCAGVVSLVVGFAAPIAASALAFGTYVHALVPELPAREVGGALIVAASLLHTIDVDVGGRVQTAFTAFKVLLILGFIVGAAVVGRGDVAHFAQSAPSSGGIGGLASALVFVSFSYSGWNGAAYLAGELRAPERTLPRALWGGTALVAALYVGLNVVFVYAVPPAALAGTVDVGRQAAIALFGPAFGRLLAALVGLALVSSVSSMVLSGPRVYVAMAEDGLMPAALSRRNRGGAPVWAVALQGALALTVLLTASFDRILYSTGFLLSVSASATVAGALWLRRRAPAQARPFRTPLGPVPALAFLALSLWMVVFALRARPVDALGGTAVIVVALAIYAVRARRRTR